MTTCRFCAKVVVNNPTNLKSIDDPSIKNFLSETSIMLVENNQPMLICKLCEMTAKQYFRFIDSIKKNQQQFEVPKPAGIKRTLPAILKNSKRKMMGENVVGMIGETTLIRLIPNNNCFEQSAPSTFDTNVPVVVRHEFETKRGESSKTAALMDKDSTPSVNCVKCLSFFENIGVFIKHLPFCIGDFPICPICYLHCADHDELGFHYSWCCTVNYHGQ